MIEVDSGSFFFFGKLAEIFSPPAYASAKRRENPRQNQSQREVLVGDGAPCDYSEHYEQNP